MNGICLLHSLFRAVFLLTDVHGPLMHHLLILQDYIKICEIPLNLDKPKHTIFTLRRSLYRQLLNPQTDAVTYIGRLTEGDIYK